MKTQFLLIDTVSKSGEVFFYFEPVSAIHKNIRFKAPRKIVRLKANLLNTRQIHVGLISIDDFAFTLDATLGPGEELIIPRNKWFRHISGKSVV